MRSIWPFLLGLVLFAAPAAQAQQGYSAPYYYTTNPDNTLTITGYDCPGGMAVIPSTITGLPVVGIGEFAFSDCKGLTGITIPTSVTSIGDGAFAACGLTNVTISDSVTNLGYGAFSDCRSLTNITLGEGLTSVGNSAFQYSGLTSVTIPNSITNLGNYAFWYSSNLTSVTIGSGVTSIGLQAFSFAPA